MPESQGAPEIDPPIILQEQKTVLASIFSVLSAIYASQVEQEYLKIEKGKYHLVH